ncbi:hybrid sensor histidine kinase/response regulator [Cyclobacterium amurskyense]|jgi:signal transduction histidine kinase|uniref:histidine kinase n=1 Tax=Cyclobacterium amurskyense TaxID=320787 RepID=A0A0H4P7X8_9BACT|nr:hybrid sensor histidine kinase/response regulator [Cyclobacterium amurskyense]AKP50274.1 Response regulator receiver sensor signal transduction histidine kinase [Cyclobacterium amurskyense]|tara:strand:+ start:64421 stop:65509 length:1089 start_codon:yes stop_codon:yes gene_type:complete
MTKRIDVLYIDDEDNNLNSFKAALRKEFKVKTAIDAEDGLILARNNEFQVVIADQRMPGMTGVEFFEKLVEINPDPIRILLTGYSDISSVIDAINRGEVYRFIDKPWNLEQIKNAILNAAEIYYARKELKEKNNRLQKLHSEMNQFVYSLSHELRGPLMSISGISKLAKMEVTDPGMMEYFDMIDSATLKLDDFIYKMLDFYRSTKIENKVVAINFQEILNQLLDEYRLKWDLDEIKISLTITQEDVFHSDESKIRVILNNLFSNAFKFQKDDSGKWIKINIEVNSAGAMIEVSDNGIGIEERHKEDVFNLFHRATQRNVGSGLGLYMVKESIEQLNGNVILNSEPGVGTKVHVHLPDLLEL